VSAIEMAISILRLSTVLIVSLPSVLADHELLQLREDLAEQVGSNRATGVVIDVSALNIMDSFATRMLRGIGETTKLRGADTVIVGIQPDVAFAMVQLGLAFNRVATGLDLQEGLDLLESRVNHNRDR
jgi:rsbT antagonist protein RsbS